MKMWKSLLTAAALSISLLSSCTVTNRNHHSNIPRDSFIYIEQESNIIICNVLDMSCGESYGKWVASGVLIAKNKKKNKSYVLTASHVCDGPMTEFPYVVVVRKETIKGHTLEGESHAGKILAQNKPNDLCLMEIEYVSNKVSKIGRTEPSPGDRLYNAAAPTGAWAPNMVILLEGYFSGFRGSNLVTTIPAAGGSSGSPVYNKDGEIVGILHSVNRRFNHISIATRLKHIQVFLKKHLPKGAKKRE